MTDGTSSTLMLSEIVVGVNDQNGNSDHRGDLYNDDHNCFYFNVYTAPNSKAIPDWAQGYCLYPNKNNPPCLDVSSSSPSASFNAARSYHSGGVNAAMSDGSVRFIKDTIAIVPWRALGHDERQRDDLGGLILRVPGSKKDSRIPDSRYVSGIWNPWNLESLMSETYLLARSAAQFARGFRLGEPGRGGNEAVDSSAGTSLRADSRISGDGSEAAISLSRRRASGVIRPSRAATAEARTVESGVPGEIDQPDRGVDVLPSRGAIGIDDARISGRGWASILAS